MTEPNPAVIASLSGDERARLIEGRLDWRFDAWQDHCGNVDCGMCEGALIPDGQPNRLSDADKVLRNHLLKDTPL